MGKPIAAGSGSNGVYVGGWIILACNRRRPLSLRAFSGTIIRQCGAAKDGDESS